MNDKKKPTVRIVSPRTARELIAAGVKVNIPEEPSIIDKIESLYENRYLYSETFEHLPQPPKYYPAIKSIYDEIIDCIVFGVNGAAITLSGILVEYVLKYASYKTELGASPYNEEKWAEIVGITFNASISRATKNRLLTKEIKNELRRFKDTVRNPYSHYNLSKITENLTVPMTLINRKTGESESRGFRRRRHSDSSTYEASPRRMPRSRSVQVCR